MIEAAVIAAAIIVASLIIAASLSSVAHAIGFAVPALHAVAQALKESDSDDEDADTTIFDLLRNIDRRLYELRGALTKK
jgi:hypothetical protein